MNTYFITGIDTEVGKTLASAIVVESLEADYWKPVQAGELDFCDTAKVRSWVSQTKSRFFNNAYALQTPMSPHASAEIDGLEIAVGQIKRPSTNNNLVIEGAGGLLVPLNKKDCIIDLIRPTDKVILVAKHYLGSINHTLLSLEALKQRGIKDIGILFNGEEHPTTEHIILSKTKVKRLGRIPLLSEINKKSISTQAQRIKQSLVDW